MSEVAPERFLIWWEDALAYARREAEAGSELAAGCLRRLEASAGGRPSASQEVFHHFSFASVGRRDEQGRFLMRELFYDLPGELYLEYTRRLVDVLGEAVEDIFAGSL